MTKPVVRVGLGGMGIPTVHPSPGAANGQGGGGPWVAACMGVEMAKTSGRTWMVSGDGAHQLTLNELAVMGRYGSKPVILVLNNGIYGVEDVLSERGHRYDDLAGLQYHLLPQAFGCQGWLSRRVATVGELEDAFIQIAGHDGAVYLELLIPEAESQPLPPQQIDQAYRLATPSG